MEYKVLYRKYRPNDFNNVYGQDYTMEILKNSIKSNKISHAYIFTGPRGTGKTSTAKIFAKTINCLNPQDGNPCGKCESCLNNNENPDIIEIDAASNNGVDEIREIINNVKVSPSYSKYKVYIVDEVHMLSKQAYNALLLTLEEPPGHVVFILATTDIQNVPITILSRCQRLDFKPIAQEKIFERIKYVCEQENIEASDEALREIAEISNGGLRDALSILDQLSGEEKKINVEDIYKNFGIVSTQKINELYDKFNNNNVQGVLDLLHEFNDSGTSYSIFVEKFIKKLEKVAVELKNNSYDIAKFDKIYNLMFDLNNCLTVANINVNPYILIEMTILKYLDVKDTKNSEIDEKIIFREIKSEKNNQEKIISREIIEEENEPEKKQEIENNLPLNLEKEEISDEYMKLLVETRVNNSFVEASKNYKLEIGADWIETIEYIEENFKNIYSLVIDSEIALASPKYAVIKVKNNSTAELINKNLKSIEDIFLEFINKEYKFICLSEENWNNQTEVFKNNKKNGIIYEYIDEPSTIQEQEKSDIEKIANELFDEEIISYE